MGETSPSAFWGGLLLLALGALLIPVTLHVVRALTPGRRVFFARWGFSHVVGVVAAGVAGVLLSGAIVRAAGIEPDDAEGTSLLLLLNVVAFSLPAALCCWVAWDKEPTRLRALGFPERDPEDPGAGLRALLAAGAATLLSIPVLAGAYSLWPPVVEWLDGGFEDQAVKQLIASLEGADLAVAAVIGILVQPFLEELLFRGFLQPLLVQNLSDRLGIVVTSVVFALMHGVHAFFPIFVLSLLIGGIMLRTRSLWAAFAIHAANNAFAFVVVVLGKQLLEGSGAS